MKSFIVFALIVAAAVAAPAGPDAVAETISQNSDNIGLGTHSSSYQTSNGIQAEEKTVLKSVGTENEAIETVGSYSHVGPDGVTYQVKYIANEYGFQPQGAHLPQ